MFSDKPQITKSVFNWSGGKDSTLALHYVLQDPTIQVDCLLTTVNDGLDRVSMHGLRTSLLIRQAESIGIRLHQVRLPEMPGMDVYEREMRLHLNRLRSSGIGQAIYGDIFLEDLKAYREKQLAELNITAKFPLWKQDTRTLLETFINLGYRTIVVCAQERLQDFCGRVIDHDFLNELPADIDPCGENGEFHTFVFDGPIFKEPIRFRTGERVFKSYETATVKNAGYWFLDLLEC
ncbi:adenine nucleotide alpha hydrolase [Pedobacter faecalis]|uniref:adenine nucleotide alpha hydrolase n=1 Tax=Pedobacter faecalis TaxID=3041495 RepID=UPI00254CC3AE|nr:adenine nucleotide alpha hydrolase [Pedobacter sp. ELA7]